MLLWLSTGCLTPTTNPGLAAEARCIPDPASLQEGLIDAINYIPDEMLPVFEQYTAKLNDNALIYFVELMRFQNNPVCWLRGKYKYTAWAVKLWRGIRNFFSRGKKIPVIRQKIKKASFLGKVADKIVSIDSKLKGKCKATNDKFGFVVEKITAAIVSNAHTYLVVWQIW